MKSLLIIAVALLLCGFLSSVMLREWVSPDGRKSMAVQIPYSSTAIDMWPTETGIKPAQNSLSELTLHRTGWWEAPVERFNISAMVDEADGGAYRFGVEAQNGGAFRPILFCFENVTPGAAVCPMKIELIGVSVRINGEWKSLGQP